MQELLRPAPATDYVVGYVVLAVSFVLEGILFWRSVRQARPTAESMERDLIGAVMATIEEAVAAIIRPSRAASANFLIGSAAGKGINVETGPGGIESAFLIPPTDDLLSHANKFTCSITFGDLGLEKVPDSPNRTSRMQLNLRNAVR